MKENPLGTIIAAIVAIVLIFVVPLMNLLGVYDETTQTYVTNKTAYFVDTVRNQGYISPEMYLDFINNIEKTGNIYDIEMIHYKENVIPVYTNPEDSSTFTGEYKTEYEATYEDDILSVLFPNVAKQDEKDTYYIMNEGDYFSVKIVNKNKTLATAFQNMFYIKADNQRILVDYGGMIRDVSSFLENDN